MNDERAIQPDQTRTVSLPGQQSRLLTRGLRHLDQPRRRLLDLGTLGGRESSATSINNQRQVVGNSETADGGIHAFLWVDGRMRDLGTLGGRSSYTRAINNLGQIVGGASDSADAQRAFLWENGHMLDLGLPESMDLSITFAWADGNVRHLERPAHASVYATDINDRGQIVGHVSLHYSELGGDVGRGFMWEYGTATILNMIPRAINNVGQIVGNDVYRPNSEGLSIEVSGFERLENRDLTNGGRIPDVGAINDDGQIVGYSRMFASPAFLLDAGRSIELGVLNAEHEYSLATGVNNRGQVVGWSGPASVDEVADQGRVKISYMRPFLWEKGKLLQMDSLVTGEDNFARPLATRYLRPELSINENGLIVGTLRTKSGDQHAFLCE